MINDIFISFQILASFRVFHFNVSYLIHKSSDGFEVLIFMSKSTKLEFISSYLSEIKRYFNFVISAEKLKGILVLLFIFSFRTATK